MGFAKWKMTDNYIELKKQIAELERRAEEARRAELASVLSEMRVKIKEYGITAADLGFNLYTADREASSEKKDAGAGRKHVEPKYLNPATGETWTGRGRAPAWMALALEQGHTKEDFLINKSEATPPQADVDQGEKDSQ